MTYPEELTGFVPQKDCLKEKTILVTGAGDGIGKQVALSFAEYGATIILVGRTLRKLEIVYDLIEGSGYPTPAIYPLNLEGANEPDFSAMHASLAQEFDSIDGLLHNAGELGARTTLANYPVTDWQKLLQVNVTAPFLMTKALIPLLQKAENASVVYTGSSVGIQGRAYWGAYAMSKAAMENVMQTWADELDEVSNIRMNSINPGATRTAMRVQAYPAEDPATVVHPQEIMATYIYLMCDASKGLSGKQINAQPSLS